VYSAAGDSCLLVSMEGGGAAWYNAAPMGTSRATPRRSARSSGQNKRRTQTKTPPKRGTESSSPTSVLARLTRSKALAAADPTRFLREVTETIARVADVERASVWLFTPGNRAIRCADLFERGKRRHSNGAELARDDYPRYFSALECQRAIAADDAHSDPRTSEFSAGYLAPLGIASMLDVPVRTEGRLAGVICLEHVGEKRQWSAEEETFAASAGDIVALGIETAQRRRAAEALSDAEARYRALVDHFPNGAVLLYDRDLRYIVAGGQVLARVDLEPDALEGKAVADVTAPDIADKLIEEYRAALRGEERIFEAKFRGVLFEIRAIPVRDARGGVIAGMVMAQDVTERRRSEAAMRDQRKLLEDAQQMARIGVFEWITRTNKVTWSAELEEIFGVKPGTFEGTFDAFLDRVHPEDRERVRSTIDQAITDGRSFQQEERILRADGSERVLISKGRVLTTTRGRVRGVVGICQDITDLKQAQRVLEEYSRTLEEQVAERTRELQEKQAQLVQSAKMASLGSLVAGIAHEVNNPLGAMLGSNDVVRRAVTRMRDLLGDSALTDAERCDRLLALIGRVEQAEDTSRLAGSRIMSLVSSLKNFARLDQSAEARVDIHDGIENTVALVQHLLAQRIRLERDYGDVPPMRCFPNKLNQVWMNLLLNAVEAIPDEGAITIRTRADNGFALVHFDDTGVGIAPEDLERVFDPGYTTKGVRVGTGLGLAIVHRIVEEHEGVISVQSRRGAGTTFRVVLPIR